MKKLFFAILMISTAAIAETKFNALDKSDPHYAPYQKNLCAGAEQIYLSFQADRYWLDNTDQHISSMSPEQREEWVFNYVITTKLRDDWRERFAKNCP